MVGDHVAVLARDPQSLIPNGLVEVATGHQEVHQVAVERVGGSAQGVESNRPRLLVALDVDHSRLRDAHPSAKLGRRHPEGVANGADPASRRAAFSRYQRSQITEAFVESGAGYRLPGKHRTTSYRFQPAFAKCSAGYNQG